MASGSGLLIASLEGMIMKRLILCAAVVALGVGQVEAAIDTFGSGGNQFSIDFVTISGSTNPTDTSISGR